MTIVKSFSVGNGDMFYIRHASDNFSIIDCSMSSEERESIVDELKKESKDKGITRFISTHPDQDHMMGLDYLDSTMGIVNFYCVKNEATKNDETQDFIKYKELRESDKAFYIYSNCSRKWMNEGDDERGSAGISILWPNTNNEDYQQALEDAKEGKSPNNISPIIKYSLQEGVTMLWMGDLESDFMEKIEDELSLPSTDIVFAPHHGRNSGKIPESLLAQMNPKIVIIGEAPSEHLNYYRNYNTITQNSAGHITFECVSEKVHIYVEKSSYCVDFLNNESKNDTYGSYIGTLNL